MPKVRSTIVAVCCGAALLATACGDAYDPDAQPRIGGERFDQIMFADMPVPDEVAMSLPLGMIDGAETQTHQIMNTEPEFVLDFYADAMERRGWEISQEPAPAGTEGSWLGAWERSGRNLVVRAEPAAVDDDPVEFTLFFSRS